MRITRITCINVDGLEQRIKNYRKTDGRTLKEIAKKAGICVGHWHQIESGKISVPEETLLKIQKALGKDLGFESEFDD